MKHCSYCFSIRKEKEIKLLDEKATTMTASVADPDPNPDPDPDPPDLHDFGPPGSGSTS